MQSTNIVTDNFIEPLKVNLLEIIKDFNNKDLESYEKNLNKFRNLIMNYNDDPELLYPILNSIFQMVYKEFKQDCDSKIKCKFLSITGEYFGEIFEKIGDLKSAIKAYAYSFILFDVKSIIKLITIQIYLIMSLEFDTAHEINHIISSLPHEILYDQDKFKLFVSEDHIIEMIDIIDLAVALSDNLLYYVKLNLNPEQKSVIKNKILKIVDNLKEYNLNIKNLIENINDLFEII